MPSSLFQQVKALVWKNLLIQSRNRRDLCRELGIPIIFLGVLTLLSRAVPEQGEDAVLEHSPRLAYDVYQVSSTLASELGGARQDMQVFVAPCEFQFETNGSFRLPTHSEPISKVAVKFGNLTSIPVRCFTCEGAPGESCEGAAGGGGVSLVEATSQRPDDVAAAFVIDSSGWIAGLQGPAQYRLRGNGDKLAPGAGSSAAFVPVPKPNDGEPPSNSFVYADFVVPFQAAFEQAVARSVLNASNTQYGDGSSAREVNSLPWYLSLRFQQLPTPAWTASASLGVLLPIYMTLIFSMQMRVMLQHILEEKEKKIIVTLLQQGMQESAYWLSWLATAAIKYGALVTVIVVVVSFAGIFEHSSFFVVWLFFVCFTATCASFAVMISALFSEARAGGGVGMLLYLASSAPSFVLLSSGTSRVTILGLSLLGPTAFSAGNIIIQRAEQEGTGITFATMFDADVTESEVSLGALLVMMLVDAALYGCIAWYLQQVIPTEYGVTLPPCFCFMPQYWGSARVDGPAAASIDGLEGSQPGIQSAWSIRRSKTNPADAPESNRLLGRIEQEQDESPGGGRLGGSSGSGAAASASESADLPHGTSSGILQGASAEGTSPNMIRPALDPAQIAHEVAVEPLPESITSRQRIRIRGVSKVYEGAKGGSGAEARTSAGWCCWLLGCGNSAGRPDYEHCGEIPTGIAKRRGDVVALNNLSIDFFQGQTTALLGQNGSGKSTLMGLLTGLFPVTAGELHVMGKSSTWDVQGVREMVSVCPQQDVFLENLTVREHLQLYSDIKGVKAADLDAPADAQAGQIDALLEELGMADHQNSLASQLSGGQKRRLTIAMSLVGDKPVLLLDEPSSSLDPSARRFVWDLINRRKKGRIIVLVTHHMQEAEAVGDRIVVLGRGKLRVAGSPMFLKSRFSTSYELTLSAAPGQFMDVRRALAAVRRRIPEAFLLDGDEARPGQTRTGGAAADGVIVSDSTDGAAKSETVATEDKHGQGEGANDAQTGDRDITIQLPVGCIQQFPGLLEDLGAARRSALLQIRDAAAAASDGTSAGANVGSSLNGDEPGSDTAPAEPNSQGTYGTDSQVGAAAKSDGKLGDDEDEDAGVEASTEEYRAAGVSSWGIGCNSLEAVFLQLAEAIEDEEAKEEEEALAVTGASAAPDSVGFFGGQQLPAGGGAPSGGHSGSGPSLGDFSVLQRLEPSMSRQIQAIFTRRMRETLRDRRGIWLMWILPIIIVGVSFALLQTQRAFVLPDLYTVDLSPEAALLPGQVNPSTPLQVPISPQYRRVGASNTVARAAARNYVELVDASAPTTGEGTGVPDMVVAADSVGANASVFLEWIRDTYADHETGVPSGLLFDDSVLSYSGYNESSGIAPDGFADRYELTVLWNGSYAGAIPATLSYYHSAVLQRLKQLTGVPAALEPGSMAFGMTFDPFPRSITKDRDAENVAIIGVFVASMIAGFYVSMGYSVVPSLQVITVVKERETQIKQLQLVQGVSAVAYWAGVWAWDAVQFIPPALGTVIVATASGVYKPSDIPGLVVLLMAFGIGLPGQGYAFSFAFNKATDAQTWTTLALLLAGLLVFGIAFSIRLPNDDGDGIGGDAVPYVLLFTYLLPTNALALGLSDIRLRGECHLLAGGVLGEDCEPQASVAWYVVGDKVVILLLQAVAWFFIVLLLESSMQNVGTDGKGRDPLAGSADKRPDVEEDQDVKDERERVTRLAEGAAGGAGRGSSSDNSLVISHVKKIYNPSTPNAKVAVKDMCVVVREGEVFGLCGANGAGKSTTQSICVGTLPPTWGTVQVCGHDLFRDRQKIYDNSLVGFCPQGESLFDKLTGREVLEFFTECKGLKKEDAQAVMQDALATLGLDKYADQPSSTYSGGNKRKLNFAIAYVNAPKLCMQDEPSAGVDPAARRRMWQVIRKQREGRATVLTTHVLEEASALSSRVGIMVNGRLACLGSPQRLRDLYGKGYQVQLSCRGGGPGLRGVIELLEAALEVQVSWQAEGSQHGALQASAPAQGGQAQGAPKQPRADGTAVKVQVAEQHSGWARLEIEGDAAMYMPQLFSTLIRLRGESPSVAAGQGLGTAAAAAAGKEKAVQLQEPPVADFTVSQCSLEQVFIDLTRLQEDSEEAAAP